MLTTPDIFACGQAAMRISTFHGAHLVGSFVVPRHDLPGEQGKPRLVAVSAGAAVLFLSFLGGGTQDDHILAGTVDSMMLADHAVPHGANCSPAVYGDSLLITSRDGTMLYVCPPAGTLKAVCLQPSASTSLPSKTVIASWLGLASVLVSASLPVLYLVDLDQHCLVHSQVLETETETESGISYTELSQGSHALAVRSDQSLVQCFISLPSTVTVFSTVPSSAAGGQPHVLALPGSHPVWDASGRYLAVSEPEEGSTSVYHGASGAVLASVKIGAAFITGPLQWLCPRAQPVSETAGSREPPRLAVNFWLPNLLQPELKNLPTSLYVVIRFVGPQSGEQVVTADKIIQLGPDGI